MMKSNRNIKALNMFLRLGSLFSKLLLSVYMGKFLPLSDIGTYGLVFSAVMIANCAVGIRVDYAISREMVGLTGQKAAHAMRDQAIFYACNYAVIIAIALALVSSNSLSAYRGDILVIAALTIVESFGNMTATNLNSMERQTLANLLFFVRSGLWAIPVVILGVLVPDLRRVDVIFTAWIAGVCASILATFWVWRRLPWGDVILTPIDWRWLGRCVRQSFFLWIGIIGLTGGAYIDRFFVNHYVGIEKVGILTFYLSFTTAVLTLVQNGILTFSYPKLINHFRAHDVVAFNSEARQMGRSVFFFSTAMVVLVGVGIHTLSLLLSRPEFIGEAVTMWLMLTGAWIRTNAESFYNVLFARHQDRAIWLGNLLFLVPAIGGNALLLPIFGLAGCGIASIGASVFILAWRWYNVRSFSQSASIHPTVA